MKAHTTLMPLVLFALAFTGTLFVLRKAAPLMPVAVAPDRAISAARAPGSSGVARLLKVAGTAPRPGAPGEMPEFRAARAAGAAPDTEESAPPADAQPSLEPVGNAIDTLKYSGSPDDRARAIGSLAATARKGVEVARVRSSLRVASADEDPDVAARAQEEYDTLVEREDR